MTAEGTGAGGGAGAARLRAPLLFLTVLVIATSGLVYELVAGALASYVLGDSVTQFSTTIGTYLFAMGVGSYLSRYVTRDASLRFLEVELAAALAGGLSAPFLFAAFALSNAFGPLLYGTIFVVGTLVGLEIPLLMRILKEELAFEELVAKVLTFDYLGALAGSLLFALVLVPRLGLTRTSLAFGMLNALVALGGTWVLADLLTAAAKLRVRVGAAVVLAALGGGFVYADALTDLTEEALYADPVVFATQTPYQRIVLTSGRGSVQLFLDGHLQFSSSDEHRYHEALVHPAMAAAPRRARVLVLGGGDGLAVRELLRWREVEAVTLVDLDRGVTDLARALPALRTLNADSLHDARVRVVNDDAMVWLDRAPRGPFDVAIVDFPDPNDYAVGKLYTRRFYRLLARALAPDGVAAVQSTSPLAARRSFWTIVATLESAGLTALPFHATVPSFGAWGFVLAARTPLAPPTRVPLEGLRYLNDATLRAAFAFPEDMARVAATPNRLNDQVLVRTYEDEWRDAY